MIMSVGCSKKKDNENIDMAKDIEQVSSSKYNNEVGEQKKKPLIIKGFFKRETGFEPAALALARRCSTTEPFARLCCVDVFLKHK
jgi:hypothetical protein